MGPGDEVLRIGRQRATQIFRYFEALNQQRNPARRQLHEQLWHLWFRNLPDHPSIRRAKFADATSPTGGAAADAPRVLDDDFVLKVRRPKLAPCPSLPEILAPWLEPGWEEPPPSAPQTSSAATRAM